MKPKLTFHVFIPTKFGIGLIIKKGNDFKDVFFKLGKKDRLKNGWIDDEEGNSQTFNQILGLSEEI